MTLVTHARVAFAGEPGAFSEQAARALWPDADLIAVRTVLDVTRAVETGAADAGVLPVENTVAGGVVAAYDALAESRDLFAVAETILDVHQCLAGIRGARLADVRTVVSHPVALAQCARFIRALGDIGEIAAPDTAGAARQVAERGDAKLAAVASRQAAERYGLVVLADRIEDRPDNKTRFLGVAREPAAVAGAAPARTSLVFTTPNEPGALLRVLQPLAERALNLSKLESRPTGEPWTYRFFADVDHEAGDQLLAGALAAVRRATRTCRVLGTYARHAGAETAKP